MCAPEDYDRYPLDEQELSSVGEWYWFDVGEAVEDWLADPGGNHGFALKGGYSGAVTYYFASSDYDAQPEIRPKLEIVCSDFGGADAGAQRMQARTPSTTGRWRPDTAQSSAHSPTPTTVPWRCELPVFVKG